MSKNKKDEEVNLHQTNKEQTTQSLEKKIEKVEDLSSPAYYLNRDVNWLDFNLKVLNEALDPQNPLLEQLKFLSIFHNNLDEFFMVRVANVFLQYSNHVDSVGPDKMPPVKQLTLIRRATLEQLNKAYTHWAKAIQPQLKAKNIIIKRYAGLSKNQKKFVEKYYRDEIHPVLTPQAIDPTHPMTIISNLSLNFIVKLYDEKKQVYYARLKCPNNLPRFILVPRQKEYEENDILDFSTSSQGSDIILLEEIIRVNIQSLFTGYEIDSVGLFRITRNTDVKIEEDEAHDLLRTVQDMVDQRRFGNVVRLEINNSMSSELIQFLIAKLDLKPFQVYKIKGIMAFSEMIGLSSLDRPQLKYPAYKPHIPEVFKEPYSAQLFEKIREKDVFLHLPYDSFLPIQEFIDQASEDPKVVAIKQTLYRTGKNSPIIKSLMKARRLGKQVTAVVELKARFDEEQNITWAEELEKSGVHVVYGIPGMKIHAKLCLVIRKEGQGLTRYVHIGTGNYNPSTAKIYTDMGIITAEKDICHDVSDLFNVMTGYARKDDYRRLLVSPTTLRRDILKCIDDEIASHKKYGNGKIHIKCNQLVDLELIQKFYRASQAGLKVHLQVRGVCCLRPNIKNVSENIEVTSIVGRFLEHPRVFCFHNNGDYKIFIGSADLMQRNLNRRIEVITPILDPSIRKKIYNSILIPYFREDNNAYYLHNDGTYARKQIGKKESSINVQEYLLNQLYTKKRK